MHRILTTRDFSNANPKGNLFSVSVGLEDGTASEEVHCLRKELRERHRDPAVHASQDTQGCKTLKFKIQFAGVE